MLNVSQAHVPRRHQHTDACKAIFIESEAVITATVIKSDGISADLITGVRTEVTLIYLITCLTVVSIQNVTLDA